MPYLSSWHKNLKLWARVTLVAFSALIFLFIEGILFYRIKAHQLYNQALEYLEKVNKIDDSLIVERVLFYQRSLRLLNEANRLNPHNSTYVFDYAQVLMNIALDEEINDLIDIPEIKHKTDLYQLAESKYKQAICLEPVEAIYHLRLGWVYESLSDSDKAEEEFLKAELLKPSDLRNHIYFAKYFSSKGKERQAFYHLCKAKFLRRYLSKGAYLSDDNEFYKKVKQGVFSRIGFRPDEISFHLNKGDFPFILEFPLGMRMYLKQNGEPLYRIYIYITYLPENRSVVFPLEFKSRQDDLLVYEQKDVYGLAKEYAKEHGWKPEKIVLKDPNTTYEGPEVIQSMELILN